MGGLFRASGPLTFAAGFVDGPSHPAATRAGLGDAKDAPSGNDLTASGAERASLLLGTRLAAGSCTGRTDVGFGESDFPFATVGGLCKLQFQVVAQVGASIGSGGVPAHSTAKELLKDVLHTAPAEGFPEDLERIMEPGPSASAIESVVTVLIVGGAPLGVAQRFIGFPDFFELFLSCFVTGILIGMIF